MLQDVQKCKKAVIASSMTEATLFFYGFFANLCKK